MHHTRLCHWNKLGMHRSSVAILHGRHIHMQVRNSVRCTVTPGKLVWVLILFFWEAVKFCKWYSDVQGNGTRCWCHLWGVLIVLPTELSHFTLRHHEQEASVWHPWEKLVFFFQRFNSDIIKRFRPFMPFLEGICYIYCNSFGQVGWYIAFLCFLRSVRVSLLYLLKAGWLSSVAKASPGETGEEHHIQSLPFSSVRLIQTSVPHSLKYLSWITQRVLQVSSWSVYQ